MSKKLQRSERRTHGQCLMFGLAIICGTAALISQTPVQIEPAPEREAIGTLTIGVVKGNLPYQDLDEKNRPTGSEYEIFSKAARGMAIEVDYVGGTERELLARLQAGTIDGIVGIAYQSDRSVAFYQQLRPYGITEIAAVVPVESDAKKLWDLRGRDVLVERGSEAESYVLNHGLARDIRRERDLETCMGVLRDAPGYAGVICDRERSQLLLEKTPGLKVVGGGFGAPRGAVLATGLNAFARDLETGMENMMGDGLDNSKALDATTPTIQEAQTARRITGSLAWVPFAGMALFCLGFVLVLITNKRISRQAQFLVSELEERVRRAELAKRDALMERGVRQRNHRTVIR